MVNLNDINIFIKVVNAGSFIGGAKVLNMPSTTVSRKVQQLEDSLGVRLLHRSTRKLSLTEPGLSYFQQCEQLLFGIEEANMSVTKLQKTPKGTLRISSPLGFAKLYVQPWVNTFTEQYPAINIELIISDYPVDLIENRIDISFRSGVLEDSNIVARAIGLKHSVCCASPEYLAKHGEPVHPKELGHHSCLLWGDTAQTQEWSFEDKNQDIKVVVGGRYSTDSHCLLAEAALSGLGIAKLPLLSIESYLEDKKLKLILSNYPVPIGKIYITYQTRKNLNENVRLFIDYVIRKSNV